MHFEPFFLGVAKIAITIAGFVGVVAALRHKRDEEWRLNELYGVKLMIEHSLAAVLAGLLPSLLLLAFADESVVWIVSSTLLAAFLSFEVLIQVVRVKHGTAAASPPRSFMQLVFMFFVPTIVLLFVQIQNIFQWHKPLAVASGAVWLLIAAGIQFMHFLVRVRVANGA